VFERLRGLFARATPANEILETALLIAVGISIASLVPAIWSQNADLAREQTIQLLIAGVTGVFCMVERSGQKAEPQLVAGEEIEPVVVAAESSYTPWHR
jgi:hypothetical protein